MRMRWCAGLAPLAFTAWRLPHTMAKEEEASPKTVPLSELGLNSNVKLHTLLHLSQLGFKSANIPNNCIQDDEIVASTGQKYQKLIKPQDCVLRDVVMTGIPDMQVEAFVRSGPRPELHFDPTNMRAAIVNCGGLCPGLNNVIHHIVTTLKYNYGVGTIIGVCGGYRGLSAASDTPLIKSGSDYVAGLQAASWMPDKKHVGDLLVLTPESVKEIHHRGGSYLGSARGGFDIDKIITTLQKQKINQVYILGGDGTHRGAYKLAQECAKRGLNIAVVGIPKTIDNDIGLIDRSFGFLSAVEAAQTALETAKVEASGNMPNGIGIVKLMGRSSGYITAYATLANGDVDLCLIPEVPVVMSGPNGCLGHLERTLARKGHAVVVVAEGAGEELLGQSATVDAGGNRQLPKIGDFLTNEIKAHFKDKGVEATIKYIDPSYMVRSVPANASDSYDCALYAQGAVHGAMAGFTGFTVGMVNNHTVLIPIPELEQRSPRTMNPRGRTWERVLTVTRQPNTMASPPEGGSS